MKTKGFTLTELMIVLAIASIVMAIAIPSFSGLLKSNQIRSSQGVLVSAFQFARTEALRRGTEIFLSPVDGSLTANEWGGGLRVWADDNGNGDFTPGEELRVASSFNNKMTLDGTDSVTRISYLPNGMTNLTATLVINVCDDRVGESGREISLLATGMLSVNPDYICP